ncbi:hypothetical protein [Enterobacter cloacae]
MIRRITDEEKNKVDALLREHFVLDADITDDTKIFNEPEKEVSTEDASQLILFHQDLEKKFGRELLPIAPFFYYSGEVYVYLALNMKGY